MANRLIIGLLVLTVSVQMLILYRQQKAPTLPAPTTKRAVEEIENSPVTLLVRNAPRLGNNNARVAIVEFADFECPFCRRHANSVLPSLKKRFIDTGRVVYHFFHLPLKMHPHAVDAANAAECAGAQGRFWEMHDLLFAGTEATSLAPDAVRKLAASLPLDVAAYDGCLDLVAGRIAEDISQASRLKAESTPVFFLGKVVDTGMVALSTRINGAQPLEVFVEAIEKLDRPDSLEAGKVGYSRR